jgi:hypothetical protein
VTSCLGQHLASYPCSAAGSRALAGHLRDDHGKSLCTSPSEDHAAHSAMHAAAHETEQREPLCTCNAFHRPHPYHGPVPTRAEPAGDGSTGTPPMSTTGSSSARSTARAAAARPRPGRKSA